MVAYRGALGMTRERQCCCRGASMLEVHRQLLLEMKRNTALKNGVPKLAGNRNNEMELKRVPAGPDPLHHNGQDTKKPRTP
ncbi:hypothetical protein ACS0TY_032706 [Phlomoides rotata]